MKLSNRLKEVIKEIVVPAMVIVMLMFLLFWGGAWLVSMVPWPSVMTQ